MSETWQNLPNFKMSSEMGTEYAGYVTFTNCRQDLCLEHLVT